MKRISVLILFTLFFATLHAGNSKKIIVYSKKGCGRCNYVKNYLKENKIKHQVLKIANNEINTEMWKLLRDEGHKGSVTMPVVKIGNEVYYNIKDLKGFVKKLE